MVASGTQPLSRTVDKVLEEATLSGVLCLHGRNLKEYPNAVCKYDLSDTVDADLARNRLSELPVQVCEYGYLETLVLYHNCLRSIPVSVQFMESLTYLDLSRNQLSAIPPALCLLPLEVLLIAHNRLEYLPREIKQLRPTLTELDVCCNRLTYLPSELGELNKMKVMNFRENLVTDLPSEMCRLRLRTLDVSSNRIQHLPLDLRFMTSLIELKVDGNPLITPQAKLCNRGRVHIFKWLEIEALRKTKRRGMTESDWGHRSNSMPRAPRLMPSNAEDYKYVMERKAQRRMRSARFKTIGGDSGYASTGDENRLSQELANGHEAPPSLRRSPPVGEETPPPPPCSEPRKIPEKFDRTGLTLLAKGAPAGSNPGSFVQEVMSACLELNSPVKPIHSMRMSNVSESSMEGSPTPKATPVKTCGGFEFGAKTPYVNGMDKSPVEPKASTPPRHAKSQVIQSLYTGGVKTSTDQQNSGVKSVPGPQTLYTVRSADPRTCASGVKSTSPDPQTVKSATHPQTVKSATHPLTLRSVPDPQPVKSVPDPRTVKSVPDPQSVKCVPDPQSVKSVPDPQPVKSVPDPRTARIVPDPQTVKRSPDPQSSRSIGVKNAPDPKITCTYGVKSSPDPQPLSTSAVKSMKSTPEKVLKSETKVALSPVLEQSVVHQNGIKEAKPKPTKPALRNPNTKTAAPPKVPITKTNSTSSNSTNSGVSRKSSFSSSQSSVSSNNSYSKTTRTMANKPALRPPPVTKPEPRSSKPRDSLSTARSVAMRKPGPQTATVENMKKALETRLQIVLPEDTTELALALADGIHLCNFINRLRPRSIPSVHTPLSTTAPLSAAKCRRNVENFLIACRRLGVPDSQLCNQADLLEKKNLLPLAKTVQFLVKNESKSPASGSTWKLNPRNVNSNSPKITNV